MTRDRTATPSNAHAGTATVVRPNFFIVGAPKCGTTALYEHLRAHPDVYMPKEKEPYFFCDDLFRHKPVRTESDYLALFQPGRGARRVGEATPWYLYSPSAAQRIRTFAPSAKIIITLRHPAEMMYSLHAERWYGGQEDIAEFEVAIRAEWNGERPSPPEHFDPPAGVETYWAVARYAPHVARYFTTFQRDRVHVLLLEDMASGDDRWFRDLLGFLDLPPATLGTTRPVNPNKVLRSSGLAQVLRMPPPWLRRVARTVLSSGMRRRIVEALWRVNTMRRPRPPLAPALKTEITALLDPEIRELESLLDRDLGRWRTTETADRR